MDLVSWKFSEGNAFFRWRSDPKIRAVSFIVVHYMVCNKEASHPLKADKEFPFIFWRSFWSYGLLITLFTNLGEWSIYNMIFLISLTCIFTMLQLIDRYHHELFFSQTSRTTSYSLIKEETIQKLNNHIIFQAFLLKKILTFKCVSFFWARI